MLNKLEETLKKLPPLLDDKSKWDSLVINRRKPWTYRVQGFILMLEEIVAEMKASAGKIDFVKGMTPDCNTKQIAIGDGLYKVMLTCDVFPGEQKLWHLSISTVSFDPVPVEAAELVRNAFFSDTESMEVPSILHGNRVKQYLARLR